MVDDPLTIEHCFGQKAWIKAAVVGDPPCMLDAVDPDEEDLASKYESAFTAKLKQWAVSDQLAGVISHAVDYPYSPSYTYWHQVIGKTRSVKEVDGVEQPWEEDEVLKDGPAIRSIFPSDFYLYPPTAQDAATAEGVMHQDFLTRRQLILGVKSEGFDKDAVNQLLSQGPTGILSSSSDETARRNELDGLQADGNDGVYQCFCYQGKMPLFFDDGELKTPEHLIEEDFCWMVCPDHNIVFRFSSPSEPFRTHDVAHIDEYPNRLMGRCIPQMLDALQSEATCLLRTKINVAEFDSQPVILKPESMRQDQDAREAFPGAEWFYRGMNPDVVKPVSWPVNSLTFLVQSISDLRQRAADVLGAGEGITQLAPQRKSATEVNQVGTNAAVRKDAFLQTFLMYLRRQYKMIFRLWIAHMSDSGEDVQTAKGIIHIDKSDLADKFIFTPNANTAAGNPQLRKAMTDAKVAVLFQYIQALMTFPPNFHPMLYHAARRSLSELGERSIEQWIGKEPQEGDATSTLMQIMPVLVDGAQKGDVAAMQALKMIGVSGGPEGGQQGQPTQQFNPMGQQPDQSMQALVPMGNFAPQLNGAGV